MTKNKKKIVILTSITGIIILILGIAYAIFRAEFISLNGSTAVTGDIYMHYNGSQTIALNNIMPMTKEEGLEATNNEFTFQVSGKNTSSHDVYYGISLEIGDVPEGKISVLPSDIYIYLESDGEVLVDGIRYQDFSNNIYVDKVDAKTTEKITKNYKLKIWLREGIIVSDTVPNANYTTEEWEKLYMSLNVKVNGNLQYMNIPLSIKHNDTDIENSKQYFIANIKNYLNPEEEGNLLDTDDIMHLEIKSDSENILFSYRDSQGNIVEEESNTLILDYNFYKKTSVDIQTFLTSTSESTTNTNITVKLTKNETEVYSQVINMDIKGTNYCLSNGFTKLGDCLLVSENLSNSVSEAKTYISNKEYDLNSTAPSYTYVEDITYNALNPELEDRYDGKYVIANGISFNANKGAYILEESSTVDSLSEDLINKYTCTVSEGYGTGNCGNVVKILELSSDFKTVTKGDVYSFKISSVLESEVGLYKTEDDYGNTYFYRGDVKNNNVYFAGYYWKIIRINGDSSIRMIYNGTSSDATGKKSVINEEYSYYAPYHSNFNVLLVANPMYQGYMFGDTFSKEETIGSEVLYKGMPATKIKFAETYKYNEEYNVYELSGAIVEKTYNEMKSEGLLENYSYFCRRMSSEGYCEGIIKINSYTDSEIFVQYISHLLIDQDEIIKNEKDSNVKVEVDEWWESNIYNKTNSDGTLLEKYIVDGTFCNDRSVNTGNSYRFDVETYFSSSKRFALSKNAPTLKCESFPEDKFSTTSTYGNKNLKYPIALPTADEIAFAGANYAVRNSNYYLNSGEFYLTMTPSHFSNIYLTNNIYSVYDDGTLHQFKTINSKLGIRPVININSNVLISSGDGSINNPFELKLS